MPDYNATSSYTNWNTSDGGSSGGGGGGTSAGSGVEWLNWRKKIITEGKAILTREREE